MRLTGIILLMLCMMGQTALGQETEGRFVPLKYGDMDHWVVRTIKESGIIGGKTKTLYEIGPDRRISENEPYKPEGGTPWASSNVMAKVSGITKTNTSVYRDKRGDGFCCKMMTHLESCKVLGLINIKVLAAGSVFLGYMREPISGTKDGLKAINWGIPFTERPKALRFDYRVEVPGTPTRIKQTGFSPRQTVDGPDLCTAVLYLQKRYEDKDGNMMAKRVGTVAVSFGKSTDGWVNAATYNVLYGDISQRKDFDETLMGLREVDYVLNSRGESVLLKETGWASADETPTHIIVQFSSSHGGAFIGTIGNTLWVDNVGLIY